MKRTTLLKVLLLAGTLNVGAQVNSPTVQGYLTRSEKLLSVGNYQACIDQLESLEGAYLSASENRQADWLRCKASYCAGYDDAAALLRAFVDTYSASANRNEAMLMLGNTILENSPAAALEIYESIDPSVFDETLAADHNYHTAYAMMQLGDFDSAAARFGTLLTNKQYGKNASFYLGYIAYSEHDYDEAKERLAVADRSSLPGAAADYYLAQIHYVEGDYNRAIACAEALLKNPVGEDSFGAEAKRIVGESLYAQGKTSKAIPYLESYVEESEYPENSALYILGISEYNKGNYEMAIEYLYPVTSDDNAMAQSAYLYIGEAFMREDNKDAALMAFNKALAMDYDAEVQEAAYYNYAVAKFAGGNIPFGSSVETFEEFLERYPQGTYTPAVQEYIVAGYLRDNNYESALASINRMVSPGDKVLTAKQRILYALGTRALSVGELSVALDYLKKAGLLAHHDEYIAHQTRLSLGETYYRLENYPEAIKALKAYTEHAPADDVNLPLGHYDLGYAYFASKDYSKAAASFEKIVNKPGNLSKEVVTDALNRIADTYFYGEQFDKAEKAYKRAYESQPATGDYPLFQQGIIQGYRRNYSSKIQTLGSLLEKFPTSSLVPDAMLEMTEGYLRMDKNAEAIAMYRRLVEEHPTTEQGRRGYIQLAMTLLNTGDRAAAIEAYKQVISLYPTSDEARIAVEEMQRIAAEDGTLEDFTNFLAGVNDAPELDVNENDRLTFQVAEQAYVEKQETQRLERYVQEFPEGAYRADAYQLLLEAAQTAKDMNLALSYATIIVDEYPDKRMAEYALLVKAQSEHALGRGNDALRSWQALESRASDASTLNTARVGIMRVARELGDHENVIAATEALLASSAIGSEARNEATFSRALAHSALGNAAAAQEGWSQIAGQTDDLYGVKSAYYLAESLYAEGKLADARTRTDAIISSATPHTYWLARAFILLSDILAAEGKTFEAREYLLSLKENYPGSETDIFIMIDQRLTDLK